ncbi:MAG: hypothetical protein OEU26_33170, partial [Candidatus Tectomicrobia bacterium]|nr:hypothetical protein [Candidatus Tectomicrobia bacterium]
LDRIMFRFNDGKAQPSHLDDLYTLARQTSIHDHATVNFNLILVRYFTRLKIEQQIISSLSQTQNTVIKQNPNTLAQVQKAFQDYTALLTGASAILATLQQAAMEPEERVKTADFWNLYLAYTRDKTRLSELVVQLKRYHHHLQLLVQLDSFFTQLQTQQETILSFSQTDDIDVQENPPPLPRVQDALRSHITLLAEAHTMLQELQQDNVDEEVRDKTREAVTRYQTYAMNETRLKELVAQLEETQSRIHTVAEADPPASGEMDDGEQEGTSNVFLLTLVIGVAVVCSVVGIRKWRRPISHNRHTEGLPRQNTVLSESADENAQMAEMSPEGRDI